MATDGEVTVLRDGATASLGDLLDQLVSRSGRKITEVVRDAEISRAYFYVLREGGQTPSLEVLVRLLTALDAEVQTGDPELGEPDLVVRSYDDEWEVRLHFTGRSAARARGVRDVVRTDKLTSGAGKPSTPRSTFVVASAPSSSRSSRHSRLLSELVSAAADLDERRLELLVANARMLAEPG